MQINLKGKNIKLTPPIKDYVMKKITNLEKLLLVLEKKGGGVKAAFEVGLNTKHHKSGAIFHADCELEIDGKNFYGSADEADLYAAIDKVKTSLFNEINKNKDRRRTLFDRGGRSVKKMLKGLSKRDPLTGKY